MGDEASDTQLLRDFVQTRHQAAFAQLVSRYVNLVHAAALRQVRSAHAAEDVTQSVFAMLARKAPGLLDERILASWLLSATRYTCLDLLKREGRLKRREQKAARMRPDVTEADPDKQSTDELSPMLDAALASLGEADRRTIVLKFFTGTSDREAAELLGVSENTLRQRRFRSLEKMRAFFRRKGMAVGSEVLASAMLAGAMRPAPPHLAAAAVQHALASGAGLGVVGFKGFLMMSWVKTNIVAVATLAVLLLAGSAMLVASHIGGREARTIAARPQPQVVHVAPAEGFAPGQHVPADAYASKRGGQDYPGGLGYLNTDTSVRYARVDFGSEASSFQAAVAVPADFAGKQIVVHTDAPDGPIVARLTVQSTGGWGKIAVQSTPLSTVQGVHDVYLGFTGSGVANLYWIRFPQAEPMSFPAAPATQPAASQPYASTRPAESQPSPSTQP